jgi:carboxypeptidase T
MRYAILFLFLTLITGSLSAQQMTYSRAKVLLEGKDISELASLGLDTDHGQYAMGRFFINDFSAKEIQQIEGAGYAVEILIEDVKEYYALQKAALETAGKRNDDCFADDGPVYEVPENYDFGTMGGYFTYQEMLDHLDNMASKFPNLISVRQPIDTFLTHEGRPIYWLKISDNPNQDETTEPEVLYTALHHAREPNSLAQLIFYMWYILENYDNDPEIAFLIDNVEMYFIPCINPDGYIYNEMMDPDGGGLWRKNKRDNDNDGQFEEDFDGVDLNRNYGYEWGFNDSGSSPAPPSQTYRGPGPFSEPETRAVAAFCNAHEFEIAQNYHTFSNLLIYPFGYSDIVADPDIFPPLAQLLTQENNYVYGTGIETVGYNVNGNSDDWMYGENTTKPAILSFTPEVGPGNFGFWPPQGEIINLNRDAMLLNLLTARVTLVYGEAEDLSDQFLAQTTGQIPLSLQRFGLKDGTLTVSIEGISDNVLSTAAPKDFDLAPYEGTAFDYDYALDPNILSGDTVLFLLSVNNGTSVLADTLVKIFAVEEPLFADSGDSLGNWVNFPNSDWDITTEDFFSAPTSITDSPAEEYLPGFTNRLTLDDPMDLSNVDRAWLRFHAKWAIEANYDYAQVLVSTNGFTFTPLCGKYSVEGSSFQDEGNPVYDGFQNDWVQEEIDLSEYLGEEEVYIRFQLTADNFIEEDGFYFDDVEIITYEEGVVNTTSIEKEDLKVSAVFPNPAGDQVTFAFNGLAKSEQEIQLQVVDALGNLISSDFVSRERSQLSLRTTDWPSGIYFYRVLTSGKLIDQGQLSIVH